MTKGFGGSNISKKRKIDSRYLIFYNQEKKAKALIKKGLIQDAKQIYIQLLEDEYQNHEILLNLGLIEFQLNQISQAIVYFEKARSFKTDNQIELDILLIKCNSKLGNYSRAKDIFEMSIKINPKSEQLIYTYAEIEKERYNLKEVIRLYEKAIKINPNNFKALSNLGALYEELKEFQQAIKIYKKAIEVDYDVSHIKVDYLSCKSFACDWSDEAYKKHILETIGIEGEAISPFELLSLEDNPKKHLIRAKNFFQERYHRKSKKIAFHPKNKIRIGYFSADFYNHATMFLMRRIFELHNKKNFEIFIYSCSNNHDNITDELKQNVNKFINITNISDQEAADLAREDSLDIAVDLKGFTKNTRLSIFSLRVAPIQISYLGYPGTTGSSCIDYIIADKVIIPTNCKKFYSEKVLYMPNCYQCNDSNREVSEKIYNKKELGIPENSFVFACFNANNKITPEEFNIWMNLLKRVTNSVLWLFKSNDYSVINLRKEAEIRGISSSRIIFAERLNNKDHLARIKCADLFLDTFNYNAHTTASDALWSGLPIVTKQGLSFSARVCSSLLMSLELKDLITKDNKDYENLAYKIASDKSYFLSLKKRLRKQLLESSLFDSKTFTKDLENIYQSLLDDFISNNNNLKL